MSPGDLRRNSKVKFVNLNECSYPNLPDKNEKNAYASGNRLVFSKSFVVVVRDFKLESSNGELPKLSYLLFVVSQLTIGRLATCFKMRILQNLTEGQLPKAVKPRIK